MTPRIHLASSFAMALQTYIASDYVSRFWRGKAKVSRNFPAKLLWCLLRHVYHGSRNICNIAHAEQSNFTDKLRLQIPGVDKYNEAISIMDGLVRYLWILAGAWVVDGLLGAWGLLG